MICFVLFCFALLFLFVCFCFGLFLCLFVCFIEGRGTSGFCCWLLGFVCFLACLFAFEGYIIFLMMSIS